MEPSLTLSAWTNPLNGVEAVPPSDDVKVDIDTYKIHLMTDYRSLRSDGRHCKSVMNFAMASSQYSDVPCIITPTAVMDENRLKASSMAYRNDNCSQSDMIIWCDEQLNYAMQIRLSKVPDPRDSSSNLNSFPQIMSLLVAVGSYAFSLVPPVACVVLASYLLVDPTVLYVLIAVDFVLQFVGWAHCAYNANEKYYDATGALTYITLTLTSLLLPSLIPLIPQTDKSTAALRPLSALTYRQIVASAAVITWAARLGRHLYGRILKSGRDSRFDDLRQSPAKLAVAWSLQGLWVFVVASAVFTINAQPIDRAAESLTLLDIAGATLWAIGFALEVVADEQKVAFAANKRHYSTPFISSGLWYYSRHPNYAGEIVLWIGLFVFSLSVRSGPYQFLTALSPLLDGALICFISGIPLLEAANDHKFGEDKAYRQYKATTPILIPNFLKANQ